MSRFSTPDEIFGPVSISRLKESDKYERAIDGICPQPSRVSGRNMESRPCHTEHSADRHQRETFPQWRQGTASPPQTARSCQQRTAPLKAEGLKPYGTVSSSGILCTCVKQEESFYKMLLDDSADHPETTAWRMANLRPRVCRMAS